MEGVITPAPMPARYNYRPTKRPMQLIPIPGNDLRVGDKWWPNPDRFVRVERIGLGYGPKLPPLLSAYGQMTYLETPDRPKSFISFPCDHTFWGDDWVVVDR